MLPYALTIFIGAFLLFQVQPLLGKFILPWFGGGPGVWTTCMLFFQLLLLGGYAYAHATTRWLRPRRQVALHLGLLATALAVLPIIPADAWKPRAGGNPTAQILGLLAVTVGLPYFVLASTGPLLQQWFTRTRAGSSPYRLYALSNVASLLALLSYPFFFETHFTRRTQALAWGGALVLYAVCCAVCALGLWKISPPRVVVSGAPARNPDSPRASRFIWIFWLLLPAAASTLLLATTNKLCLDVAVVPFLWVLPLAIYLLSFVISFDSPRWYARFPFTLAFIAAVAAICWALFNGSDWPLRRQILVYAGGLFVCCMVCHGELYRLRPPAERLTGFYLMIAAGGALGGIFVAVIAPKVFTNYFEMHCGLVLCAVLFVAVCLMEGKLTGRKAIRLVQTEPVRTADPSTELAPDLPKQTETRYKKYWNEWIALGLVLPVVAAIAADQALERLSPQTLHLSHRWRIAMRIAIWAVLLVVALYWIVRGKHRTFQHWRGFACSWLVIGLVPLTAVLWRHIHRTGVDTIFNTRNFYGVLSVYDYRRDEPKSRYRLLQHGRITHGLQFVDPEQATWPTTYYGEGSGVSLAINALTNPGRHVGLVGLGTGTLSAYARPGDHFRIYEINPQVRQIATNYFSYVTHAKGDVQIVLGDARLSLERERPQQFDLLALDAFSSDSIPVHLLTRQAFELYGRHLKTNGIIAVHISNHYLDLQPVVLNLAREFKYKFAIIDYEESDDDWWLYGSTWILLSRDEELLRQPSIAYATSPPDSKKTDVPTWTDDFTSLYQILK